MPKIICKTSEKFERDWAKWNRVKGVWTDKLGEILLLKLRFCQSKKLCP